MSICVRTGAAAEPSASACGPRHRAARRLPLLVPPVIGSTAPAAGVMP
jgi:hypothetical protein